MSVLDIKTNLNDKSVEIEQWLEDNCIIQGKHIVYKRGRKWLVDVTGTITITGECKQIPYNIFHFDKIDGYFIIDAPLETAKGLPKMIAGDFCIKTMRCYMRDYKNYPGFITGTFIPCTNLTVYDLIRNNALPYCYNILLDDISDKYEWSYNNLKELLINGHYVSHIGRKIIF